MAKAPQANGSPNDDESGVSQSPATNAATRQLEWDIDSERFWKILDDEDIENFLRVARQSINPLA